MCKRMIKQIKLTITTLTIIAILFACRGKSDSDQTDDTFIKSLTERRIKETNFYISLPIDYSIKENEGPDFTVHYFSPTDTTVKANFSGGFYIGYAPREFRPFNDSCKAEIIKGEILNDSNDWTVYSCNGKYSIQVIVRSKSLEGWKSKIHAFGQGASKNEIDKIFKIYSTLKLKRK